MGKPAEELTIRAFKDPRHGLNSTKYNLDAHKSHLLTVDEAVSATIILVAAEEHATKLLGCLVGQQPALTSAQKQSISDKIFSITKYATGKPGDVADQWDGENALKAKLQANKITKEAFDVEALGVHSKQRVACKHRRIFFHLTTSL